MSKKITKKTVFNQVELDLRLNYLKKLSEESDKFIRDWGVLEKSAVKKRSIDNKEEDIFFTKQTLIDFGKYCLAQKYFIYSKLSAEELFDEFKLKNL